MTDAGEGKDAKMEDAEWAFSQEAQDEDWEGVGWQGEDPLEPTFVPRAFTDEGEEEEDVGDTNVKRRAVELSVHSLQSASAGATQRQGGPSNDIWRLGNDVWSIIAGKMTLRDFRSLLFTAKGAKGMRRVNVSVVVDETSRSFLSGAYDSVVHPHAPWIKEFRLRHALDCVGPRYRQLWLDYPWHNLGTFEVTTYDPRLGQKLLDVMHYAMPLRPKTFRNFIVRAPGLLPRVHRLPVTATGSSAAFLLAPPPPPIEKPKVVDMTSLIVGQLWAKDVPGPTEWLALTDVVLETVETLRDYLLSRKENHRPTKLELHVKSELTIQNALGVGFEQLAQAIEPCGPRLTALRISWPRFSTIDANRLLLLLTNAKVGSQLTELQFNGNTMEMSPALFRQWLRLFPNLSVFQMQPRWKTRPPVDWPLTRLRSSLVIPEPGDWTKLEVLEMTEAIRDETEMRKLADLMTHHPALRRVSLHVFLTDRDKHQFANLIRKLPLHSLRVDLHSRDFDEEDAWLDRHVLAPVLRDHASTLHSFTALGAHWEVLQEMEFKIRSESKPYPLRHFHLLVNERLASHEIGGDIESKHVKLLSTCFPLLETIHLQECKANNVHYLYASLPHLRDVVLTDELTGDKHKLLQWAIEMRNSSRLWAIAPRRQRMEKLHRQVNSTVWAAIVAHFAGLARAGLDLVFQNYDPSLWKSGACDDNLWL